MKSILIGSLVFISAIAAQAGNKCVEINGSFRGLQNEKAEVKIQSVVYNDTMAYKIAGIDVLFFADGKVHSVTQDKVSGSTLTTCTSSGFTFKAANQKGVTVLNGDIEVINSHGDIAVSLKYEKATLEDVYVKASTENSCQK